MTDEEVALIVNSYPASGDTSSERTICFGPASDELNILVTVHRDTGKMVLTIGNGPILSRRGRNEGALPSIFRELADIFEEHIE